MNHPETHLVTEKHGPRPAGKPDECFYCKQKVGEEHKPDCVLRKRTIVLACTFELTVDVPEDWTEEQIDFFYNEGTHCSDNELDRIVDLAEKRGCACSFSKFSLLREATKQDEKDGDIPADLREK